MALCPSLPHTIKSEWIGAHDFRCSAISILYKNKFSVYLIVLVLLFYNNKLLVEVPLVSYLYVHLNDVALSVICIIISQVFFYSVSARGCHCCYDSVNSSFIQGSHKSNIDMQIMYKRQWPLFLHSIERR